MTEIKIAAIVEGHGECEAVPILVRRIALDVDPGFVPCVLSPLRIPASRLVKQGEIERSIDLVARKLQGQGGIIVILDCDAEDCCPAQAGPQLLERARASRGDILISVVLAKKEFEAWFIAAADSLRGKRNLANDLQSPSDPEGIRDAKGWLGKHMPSGYDPVIDQASFTHIFSFCEAAKNPSFRRLLSRVRAQIRTMIS
mgnify:CR=1 FL=1